MDPTDLLIFSAVDGIAEVWPVDAASHALLAARFLGRQPGSLGIAIHFGAALAIIAFLWREVGLIGQGLLRLRKLRIEPGTQLLAKALLVIAPTLAARAALGGPLPLAPADLLTAGIVTILAALAMGIADRLCMTVKRIEHLGVVDALIFGTIQLLAYVPGVGGLAAGLTIARLLGFERPAAYRFLLLAEALLLFTGGGVEACANLLQGHLPAMADLLAGTAAFVLTLIAVAVALSWVRRAGLLPFVVYRLMVAAALIAAAVV
ncbi:MAG TPA: undecaprenyl-diphosphate phosphatase [Rhodospirillaceae bacterium]|nr:undecaprenyl-diphosphate phosphatase [Rhodospirillaceae bacterium]